MGLDAGLIGNGVANFLLFGTGTPAGIRIEFIGCPESLRADGARWLGYVVIAGGKFTGEPRVSSNADCVSYRGRGCWAGTLVLAGGGDIITDPAIGVRYRWPDMEDIGRRPWLWRSWYEAVGIGLSSSSVSSSEVDSACSGRDPIGCW